MKIELKTDAFIHFEKGTVMEVSDQEASRLVALNNAVIVKTEAEEKTQKRSKKRSE